MTVVAIVLLVLALAFVAAGRLHRFAYWIEQRPRAAIEARAQDGWQLDVLPVEPGVELVGLVRPPRDAAAPWLLLLPGNATAVIGGFQPWLQRLAEARSMGAAFWPWRGFDASTGTPSPPGLLQDARAAWQRLTQERGIAPAQVELWGYSLGSGVAVQLAAELCRQGTPPRRLVLVAAYDRIAVMRHGMLGRFQREDAYDALASAGAVTCPVVIVHGTADDALPIAGARALQAVLPGSVQFVALEGRGHVDVLSDPVLHTRW